MVKTLLELARDMFYSATLENFQGLLLTTYF